MQAILLAAGVGRRLASVNGAHPKCLLSFGGKTLLQRHIENLERLGIERLWIVVGHEAEMIRDAVERMERRLPVEAVTNEHYREGSILSMRRGLEAVLSKHAADTLIMDADVLYHPQVLERLARAPFDCGFLLDPRAEAKGEEMMLGVRASQVLTITRKIGASWDLMGEGVGFFRLPGRWLADLKGCADALVAAGERNADYERAIDAFLKDHAAGYVSVADLPWTEIDFDDDVERAKSVLPAFEPVQ